MFQPAAMAPRAPGPLVRERKFVSDRANPRAAVSYMAAWAAPDPEFPEGELESVYFDTPDLEAARAKADGDARKRKVRLRWYRGGPAAARRAAWLEIKDRVGSARDKARCRVECDAPFLDDAPLSDPRWRVLLGSLCAEAGFPLGEGLYPTVSIRYKRARFVCPETGSRLSVDWDISCPRANGDAVPFASALPCPLAVVEAKSATAWDWPFADGLSALGFHAESFSKYGYFLERLVHGAFR